MNIGNLMGTPLMRHAKIIAGKGGNLGEVTWSVPDSNLQFDNWIMPGLLIVATQLPEHADTWIAHVERFPQDKIAGIVFFTNGRAVESIFASEDDRARIESWHNKHNVPLIALRRSNNIVSFLKGFALTASSWFRHETQEATWLQEICFDPGFSGADSLAAYYNYNPEYGYYASILAMRKKPDDRVQAEMDLSMAQSLLHRDLSFKDAPVLSFIRSDAEAVVAFLPRPPQETRLSFRSRVDKIMRKPRGEASGTKWRLFIGTRAHDIAMFNQSFVNASQTSVIIDRLRISDRIAYYNDYYMHMLLLDKPQDKLREQMEYVLAPILDSPELLESLTNYLVFGESLKIASKKTFVHVNTLKYRLGRISELLACDLKDPNVRFKLRMAITIYRYLNGSEAA